MGAASPQGLYVHTYTCRVFEIRGVPRLTQLATSRRFRGPSGATSLPPGWADRRRHRLRHSGLEVVNAIHLHPDSSTMAVVLTMVTCVC